MTNTDLTPSAGRPPAPPSPFARLVNELGIVRLGMIAAVAGAVVIGVVYLSNELTKPPLGLLYANLSMEDAASIAEQLRQQDVAFEMRGSGSTIFVDQSKILDLRMQFASEGLPKSQDVGYEIFDEQSVLGQTSFQQNINRQRALEGELARTIRSLSKIENARVHLVLPQKELFNRDEKKPTASIVVKTRGFLDRSAVQSIQHLVASAVPGLSANNISIVDENGTLLASGGESQEETIAATSMENRQAAYEERLRSRILNIVNKYTGTGNAQVQVSAEMDFNRVTEQSTVFDPDSQVVASSITIEESENDRDGQAGDQGVTVANNLPNATQTQSDAGTESSSARNRTEEEIKYQNSQTVRTEVREAGRVTRLSVAVLVDGVYELAGEGEKTYSPREQADLDQIAALVRAGIGFDEKRGDQLTVANLPFAQSIVPEPVEEEGGSFLNFTKADYLYLMQMGILALVGIVVLLFVVRPLLSGLMKTAQGTPLQGGQLAPAGAAPAGALPGPDGTPAAVPGPDGQIMVQAEGGGQIALPPSDLSAKIDIAQIEGQVKESSIKKIGEVVVNHPDESVAIVRNWLQEST